MHDLGLLVAMIAVALVGAGCEQEPAVQPPLPPPSVVIAGYGFDAPSDWTSETPDDSERLVQIRIAQAVADQPQDAVLAAYAAPSDARETEAQVNRWVYEFAPAGSSAAERIAEQVVAAGPLSVRVIEVSGRMESNSVPGVAAVTLDDWAMLLAIVPTSPAPTFVRLVGPKATIDARREEILRALASFRKA